MPQRNDEIIPSAATRFLIICEPLAFLFLCHPSLHLLLVFRVPSVHPRLSNSLAEVVSMATAQEIGGRGFGAVAGRERWSALDKPPSIFSLSPRPSLLHAPARRCCVCVFTLNKKLSGSRHCFRDLHPLCFTAGARWSTPRLV